MDPLLPADPDVMEREADKDARRKIQFSVPCAVPTQLDPLQVEMWVLGENGALKAKLVHTATYQPPSLKAVQRMALAHLASLDTSAVDKEEPSSGEEEKEREKESQQTVSAPDLWGESKLLREQRAPPDCLTGSTDVSRHRGDKDKANEREEDKGE
ncbi:Protein phosphatase 1 regulatory subunit 1B [Liparis tanakae]|uniref:Protein phosphatase 1 regulatory subunit 1B n=1 Tax=Liparis tanakae TaxID=230148 RepID=A0A4Z2GME3_9TELE|nr:Protein phosphatase 1 regulatory subunit 1B [Liparis tanakae]